MTLPIQGVPIPSLESPAPAAAQPKGDAGRFASTLKDAMEGIDQLQGQADEKVSALLDGSGGDIHDAMIAVQRADLSFQLMMQVRNKIVNAYQEISRMQF